jgi:hypothetical protein
MIGFLEKFKGRGSGVYSGWGFWVVHLKVEIVFNLKFLGYFFCIV